MIDEKEVCESESIENALSHTEHAENQFQMMPFQSDENDEILIKYCRTAHLLSRGSLIAVCFVI